MNFLVDTPYTPALVRNEFLHDQKIGHNDYTEVFVFAFRAEPMRVPMFQIMTSSGAQWARIPIHALVSKPCQPMSLQIACCWDSFSRNCNVVELAFLRRHRMKAIGKDGVQRPGVYQFTVAWCDGGYSEVPDQSKDHHICVLDAGQWVAYPNNRIHWQDPSWITQELPKTWKSPTDNYSVETIP